MIELVLEPRVPAMGAPNPSLVETAKPAVPPALARVDRELGERPGYRAADVDGRFTASLPRESPSATPGGA